VFLKELGQAGGEVVVKGMLVEVVLVGRLMEAEEERKEKIRGGVCVEFVSCMCHVGTVVAELFASHLLRVRL
jgi:hypothetical protein